jgi:hypothetical protein
MDGHRTRIVAVAVLTGAGLTLTGWDHAALGDVNQYAGSPMVGMNVGGLSNQSTQFTLSNYYLSAGGWNYFPDGSVSYDSQGNPILNSGQLAGQNIFLQNSSNAQDLVGIQGPGTNLDNVDYPAGVYTITWTGTGSIGMSEDDVDNHGGGDYWTSYGNESTVNTETFTVAPGTTSSGGGLYMEDIYASNGTYNSTAQPISNIHIYAPTYAPGQANAGQTFTTQFTSGLKPFGTLRFMDAMNTNSDRTVWTSLSTSSSPGPQTSDETWMGSAGMPVAAMVALANQTNTNPWFNMPAYATSGYITQFAQYVKANLNPNLKVYVEYGNEDWAPGNPGNAYISQSTGTVEGTAFDAKWASVDESVFQAWEQVYTGSATGVSSSLVRVAALQTSNTYDSPMFLSDLKATANAAGVPGAGFDAVADAPYFGPTSANVASYSSSTTAAQILSDMVKDIQTEAAGDWATNKAWANQYGVPLIGYEGGQGLVNPDNTPATEAWYAAYVAAEESPQMEQVYQLWLDTYLNQVGGSEVNDYSLTGAPSQFGAWGSMEYSGQTVGDGEYDASKYQGLLDFLNSTPEPATLSLIVPAGFLLLARRRRSAKPSDM